MDLLYHDALTWGSRAGFATCDFGGMSREIAEALLAGHGLTEAQHRSRDFFHLRFGGRPALLPAAVVYVPNPVLRWGLKTLLGFVFFRRLARRALLF